MAAKLTRRIAAVAGASTLLVLGIGGAASASTGGPPPGRAAVAGVRPAWATQAG